jgi:hypothetical protein
MEAGMPVKAMRPLAMGLQSAAAAILWSGTSLSAGPTVDACVDANEDAQDLSSAGRLLEARARLAACIAPGCPRPVRDDCADRLRAVERAIPTIVFAGPEGEGADPDRISITLDGLPLPASGLAGPIPVDPGAHQVVFESDGHASSRMTLLVRVGDKDRVVLAEPAPSRTERRPMQRPVGLVIGGVGLAGVALGGIFAALAKSTDSQALNDECGGNSSTCSAAGVRDGERAHAQARAATIALIGGGVLLGAGAAIYFTAPGGHRVSLGSAGGAGRTGLVLNGDF